MPRPPARRTRAAPEASTETARKTTNLTNPSNTKTNVLGTDSEGQARAATPELPTHTSIDTSRSHQLPLRPTLTPTRNAPENALVSSPNDRPATGSQTGSRPPTRARGYSSTLSLAGRKGDVTSRIGSTPGFESSILSNFRRRPRQPSLLQMMQADESSDLDDDDFLGGLSPEDESTPLNATKPSQIVDSPNVSPSRGSNLSSPASKDSRKRKRTTLNHGDSNNPPSAESSPISSPMQTPRPRSVVASVDTMNFVLATPLSSPGSVHPSVTAIDEVMTAQVTKNTVPKIATSILQAKFLPRRRIRRRKSYQDYDEGSESLAEDSDEDELNRVIGTTRRRPQKRGLSDATTRNVKVNTNGPRYSDRGSNKTPNGVKRTFPNLPDSQSKTPRTYSRRETQVTDKENYLSDGSSDLSSLPPSDEFDSDYDITIRDSGGRIASRELEQAVLKFKEVDKWQMEFEDVSFF
ncbi:hypothetical protein BGW36DRAFT_427946 [Talaromyces proteolyticus]|uniref:Uncharacterized protein n=1 Tax=Talaromyces proteolyticus TaxID=1131652 RepID=A0AAD4KTQ6_9EURO|nr:uncharacterized protein BGW36DRAFT_427946 [Talaromyces proteolyticus]KAH8695909.1 hypothetical protein BGW36DRAFT_427946 [Talaromyces proteolyticus]